MLRWITRWLRHGRNLLRGGSVNRERSKLMGLYLHQTNQEKGRRWEGDTAQERRDGKYAQKRGRD